MGQEDPLEEGMATHSSILAWKIPWTEEAGKLESIGCKELDMTEVTEYECMVVVVVMVAAMYGGLPQRQILCRALCLCHLTHASQQVLTLWLCLQIGGYKNEATFPRSPKRE